jgi:Helicase associated domain
MTDERVQLLIDVGMGSSDYGPFDHASAWDANFRELLAFRDDHGHCEVSRTKHAKTHPSLSRWVERQRTAYQQRQKNAKLGVGGVEDGNASSSKGGDKKPKKQIQLTDERMKKLRDIGFRFETTHCDFEERFASLCMYKAVQ